MSRSRLIAPAHGHPRLERLVQAARTARHDAEGGDTRAVARVLDEFGRLASWAIPVHGLFVPNNNDVCAAVESAARAHLGLDPARRELARRLKAVPVFEQRDAIETAQTQVRHVYDEAYFYAGVAFGVTFVDWP